MIFQMLNSPYYEKWFYPEIRILEATVYVNLCKFDQAKLALADLQTKFLDKKAILEKFRDDMQNKEPSASWTAMMTYYEGDGEKKTGLPRVFVDAVMNDLSFYNNYKVVQILEAERDALKANIGSLGEFGQEVLKSVEEQLKIKVESGGLIVQERLQGIINELQALDIQATQISFDITKEEKRELEQRLKNQGDVSTKVDAGTTLFVVAEDWHPWPFEGEYWVDEVSNYRSNLRTECVEQ